MRRYVLGNGTVTARVAPEFAALLEALQFQGADHERLLRLTDSQWGDLLELADLAHLTLPLALRRPKDVPDWVIERLEANLRDNRLRFEAIYTAYREVAEALERADIAHIVLKGFAQAPEFVKEPKLRVQSDLDLYCASENAGAARLILEKLGYVPLAGLDYQSADHSPTMVRRGSWVWRGNMYDPEMPPSVEIHFCFWNERVSQVTVPGIDAFRARRRRQEHGRYSWWALQTEDKVAFLALHILRGIFYGDWIVHHVYELASFLNESSDDPNLWENWARLHSPASRTMQAIAFSLAQSWFCCRLAPEVENAVEAIPDRQRVWLIRFGGSPLECMFRRNRLGRLLQLTMITRPADRQDVIRRIFIPPVGRPDTLSTKFVNRRLRSKIRGGRMSAYSRYLMTRLLAHVRIITEVLWHGISLWLAKRSYTSQFWTLLGACFFLTWGYLSIISSSTFI